MGELKEFFQKLFSSKEEIENAQYKCTKIFEDRLALRAKYLFEREITRAIDLYGPIDIVWYNPTMVDNLGRYKFSSLLSGPGNKMPFIKKESEYGDPTIEIFFKDGTSSKFNFKHSLFDALDPVSVHRDAQEATLYLENKKWLRDNVIYMLKVNARFDREKGIRNHRRVMQYLERVSD